MLFFMCFTYIHNLYSITMGRNDKRVREEWNVHVDKKKKNENGNM